MCRSSPAANALACWAQPSSADYANTQSGNLQSGWCPSEPAVQDLSGSQSSLGQNKERNYPRPHPTGSYSSAPIEREQQHAVSLPETMDTRVERQGLSNPQQTSAGFGGPAATYPTHGNSP